MKSNNEKRIMSVPRVRLGDFIERSMTSQRIIEHLLEIDANSLHSINQLFQEKRLDLRRDKSFITAILKKRHDIETTNDFIEFIKTQDTEISGFAETIKTAVSECCLSIADGDHQPPPKAEQGIPFVTISNITASNRFDFSNTLYVPQNYYDQLDEKRKAREGDVLYSVVGSFGIPVFMKGNKEFVFQRHIAILRPDRDVIVPQFLFYTMLTRDFYAKADAAALGAAQRTVSLTSLRNIEINIPEKKRRAGEKKADYTV